MSEYRWCERHGGWDRLGWPGIDEPDGWHHVPWLGTTWSCGHSTGDYTGHPDERYAAHARAHRFDWVAPALLAIGLLLLWMLWIVSPWMVNRG